MGGPSHFHEEEREMEDRWALLPTAHLTQERRRVWDYFYLLHPSGSGRHILVGTKTQMEEACPPGWTAVPFTDDRIPYEMDRPLQFAEYIGTMPEMQTCGRRMMDFGHEKLEGLDHWEPEGTCSFCSSLRPERFFEAVEAGAEVVPTDKNYKVYVRTPEREFEFYFQHLDDAGQKRFIELYNAGKMRMGYPGAFYRLPFFAALNPSTASE